VGRLRLGPHVVGRLESGVWVCASFEIFALTVGMLYVGRKVYVRAENVRENMSRG